MYRKLLASVAVIALASFAFAACGDDDEDTTSAATTSEETTTTDTGSSSGGGGATVTFTADPGGALSFEEKSAETTAGSVTVELVNESSTPHDVTIESPDGEDVGETETITGSTTTTSVDLEAGDYTFYCSVPGHREAGMEGTLTVK